MAGELIKINGQDYNNIFTNVKITPYIVDSAEAGRTQAFTMFRDPIGKAYSIEVTTTTIFLDEEEISELCSILQREWFDVTFRPLGSAEVLTYKFYCASYSYSAVQDSNGNIYWNLYPFTLVHQGISLIEN